MRFPCAATAASAAALFVVVSKFSFSKFLGEFPQFFFIFNFFLCYFLVFGPFISFCPDDGFGGFDGQFPIAIPLLALAIIIVVVIEGRLSLALSLSSYRIIVEFDGNEMKISETCWKQDARDHEPQRGKMRKIRTGEREGPVRTKSNSLLVQVEKATIFIYRLFRLAADALGCLKDQLYLREKWT